LSIQWIETMLPQQPNPFPSLSDKHTIETPEQMPIEFTVAGIGSRFLALAIDTLIQLGIGLLLFILVAVLGVTGTKLGFRTHGLWLLAILGALVFLLTFGYFAAFEILWSGQTPGKRLIGIRVVKDSGRPLTPSETIGRNLLRIIDQMPAFFYAVGVIVALFNKQNKRIGDFIAGSIVVRESSMKDIKPIWQTSQSATEQPQGAARLSTAALTVEELALIDTFLQRRHDLSPDVRSRMAGQILNQLKPKLAPEAAGRLSTESLLEALAYERRSMGIYS
jgi:uncharacterized RDD family membrane protein YckC